MANDNYTTVYVDRDGDVWEHEEDAEAYGPYTKYLLVPMGSTVIPPTIDEPEGLGAVVTFEGDGYNLSAVEHVWLRDPDGDWLDEDSTGYTWADLLSWANRSTIKVQTEGYVRD